MTRIALLSTELLFLEALASLFNRFGSFQVVCQEMNVHSFLNFGKARNAQIYVVDATKLTKADVQFLNGAKLAGGLLLAVINSPTSIPIDADLILSKQIDSEELFQSLNTLAEQLPNPVSRYVKRLYRTGNSLTEREQAVARLMARGHSNADIAKLMSLQEQSIKNLASIILRKLKCKNRTQVAIKLANLESEPPS